MDSEAMQEGLHRSKARFVASMSRIIEQYNQPFEDDILVSIYTLTYDTTEGPKRWDKVSRKDVRKWKETLFEHKSQRPKNTGEESGDIVSVERKFESIHLQNLIVDDGQIFKEEIVPVDVILQGDERNIPKWIKIKTPISLKSHRSTSPGQKLLGSQAAVCRKKLELSNKCSSSKYPQLHHSAVPISSNTIASPRIRPCPELRPTSCDSILGEYQSADEECSLSNTTLADLYPAMVEIFTKLMAKHSQKKVLKYMFGHLRSKKRHSRRPKLNVTVDKMRGFGPCKLKKSFHSMCSCRSEDNQNPTSGNESREFCHDSCPISNSSGLVPYAYADTNEVKMRGFGPCKLKKSFHSMCSCRSEDNQNPTSGNESREFCHDSCPISNSSGLVPYAYADTNEVKMHYSDSSLEQHLASRKSLEICKHATFPDVMDRMGETFLVEDELQTTATPKHSEYREIEKYSYKCFSGPSFITSTASSDSRAFYLVKENKTQKTDFFVGTSELCSSACSSHGNRNNSIPITNCSPARSSSNTVFVYPQKIISERQTSFQYKDPFSSWFMKQSPSKKPDKYEDAFEELYYKVCSEEFQKPLTLTRPLLNSQNLEEKGRLVKSNLSDSGRSAKQCDIEFDRLYEKLCGESVTKSPGLQTASNFRKYEEIQIPETVNALVNSPVRTYSAISRVRRGNFENQLPCSPEKRLKLTPEYCFSSRKCQDISHSKKGNLQTGGMDFLSKYNCSSPSSFADHNCHCQGSGSHDSSDESFLGIPGTSLQESGTAGAHSGWPGAMENCSSFRNVRKCHPRVYRKLSYSDGKDQL
ncbi:Holliday junction recognition protein isoform X2 [Vidua chalybeata]|uniref:Holliday junction recognition protein isoform X2 n=1 Tax=Vidua chalybeata TaxID=81927 RepID=UPI0023A8C68C|nr:Holliday junction recognition protein isoform X2 [Vidua chalybeata]